MEKKSKNKIDLLKPILRENLINKIIGTWNLNGSEPIWTRKDLKTAKQNDTLMVISNQEIAYYVENIKTKENRLFKTDEIKFYDGFDNTNSVTEMINSENELWTFIVDESLNSLRLIHTGNVTSSGREIIDIDNKESYYIKIK